MFLPSYQTIYLSLGSNLGDTFANLNQAREELSKLSYLLEVKASSIYYTEPQEKKTQPWFSNQVLKFYSLSTLKPMFFLQEILEIEKKMGRKRKERFGPRIIDIDILLFDKLEKKSSELILPHPKLVQRAFVLVPLKEIEPNLKIKGKSLSHYLKQLKYRVVGNKIYQ